jgi:hypothetical protein
VRIGCFLKTCSFFNLASTFIFGENIVLVSFSNAAIRKLLGENFWNFVVKYTSGVFCVGIF